MPQLSASTATIASPFGLQPDDRVQLIFHRGVKKRSDSDKFVFEDASGMMDCVTKPERFSCSPVWQTWQPNRLRSKSS
ncbi:MAG: hypothetical protein ACR2ME_09705 [Acidimicrobiia bacterium]